MVIGEVSKSNTDYLLDTGILIRHLRDDRRAHDLLDHLEKHGDIKVSSVTLMEILVGCHSQEEEDNSLFVFDRVSLIVVCREVAQKASKLIRKYPLVFGRGIQRGTPDAIIAATAWHDQRTLLTFNTRHFARVPITEIACKAIDQDAPDWISAIRA